MVSDFFSTVAQPLARMVYGKRAASSLHALAETLRRRRDRMGSQLPTVAAAESTLRATIRPWPTRHGSW